MTSAPPVRLVDERRYDPPRRVQAEHNGQWWDGWQAAWRLCDDGRGWMADVEWVELYEWGLGKHIAMLPPERLRPTNQKRHSQPAALLVPPSGA